jgi:hypothetical protein
MSTPADDAPPPPRLSDDALKAIVKDLNKKEKFEVACLSVHAQVTHHAANPPKELFSAVLRVGTVLKTRHAEDSPGWFFGLRLFKDAVEGGRFNQRSDVNKLQDLLNAALAATDAEPENGGDGDEGRPDAPQAFEGQLSGDLETEFDRQRRTGASG